MQRDRSPPRRRPAGRTNLAVALGTVRHRPAREVVSLDAALEPLPDGRPLHVDKVARLRTVAFKSGGGSVRLRRQIGRAHV